MLSVLNSSGGAASHAQNAKITAKAQAPQTEKKAEVGKLFSNMQVSAQATAPVYSDILHRQLDLAHYKNGEAYPGSKYFLVGNARDGQNKRGVGTKKRAVAVDGLFNVSSGKASHNWQKLSSALKHKDFYESLSRFEQYLLSHEPPNSVVGLAYDEHGKQLSGAFALWRLESAHHQRAEHYNYSNPAAQYSQPQQQGQQKGHKRLVASK